MSLLKIVEFPDPRLRIKATEVTAFDADLKTLADDMLETMYAASGIGLAAIQVDVHKRILVLDVSESGDQPMVIVNPVITARDGTEISQEGCLSVPGIYADVERAESITVEARHVDGSDFTIEADGLLAVCIQHEIDHLDGKLFVDYLSPLKRQMVRRKLAKKRRQSAPEQAAASA